MEKKTKVGSTTQVNITDDNRRTIGYTSKASIEELISKGKDAIGYQTEGGSQLLSHTFKEKVGTDGEVLMTIVL